MMQKTKKVLVITDNMPWGHRSIAKSIYGALKKREKKLNITVEYMDFPMSLMGFYGIYTFVYRYFPGLGAVQNNPFFNSLGAGTYEKIIEQAQERLEKVMQKKQPDVIISAYYFISEALVRIKKRKFKLATVYADPWTLFNKTFVKNADWHLVYDEKSEKQVVDFGIDPKKIIKTGWWVREEMYKKYKKPESDRPVIFVGGGSLGNSAIPKILPLMILLDKKVKFIFNCGTDRMAYRMVNQYKWILKKLGKDKLIQVENLGWVQDMAEQLAKCDIVLGKAGPNFIFDCVACGKPFVAVSHISGQETGNLALIKEKKLGWVRESTNGILKFLKKYLDNPDKYNKMYKESIAAEALRNKKTHQKFTSIVAFPR